MRRWLWPSAVVHRFMNDAVPLELSSRQPLRLRRASQVAMEIRRTMLPTTAGATAAFGVFVAAGSHLETGDLAGCYSGAVVHGDALVAKKEGGASGVDVYSYDINETHFVAPTSASGRIDDTQPPFRVEMAAVNEPTAGPPNVTPLDYAFGLCRDRRGDFGVPYYATRRIEADEELLVCYGAAYERASYASDCADEARSDEWTRRDFERIRPLITRRVAANG